MPTYEYACSSCGEHLEVVQSFRDEALTVCPSCGGSLRKVFGSVGVVFKGSGFYKTDSRVSSKSEKKSEKSDKPAAAHTDSAGKKSADGSSGSSGPAKTDGAGSKSTPSAAAAS